MSRLLLALLLLLGVTACSSISDILDGDALTKGETPGERQKILATDKRLETDRNLTAKAIDLPKQIPDADWPSAGGNPSNVASHPLLAESFTEIWSRDIGAGSSSDRKILARPVVSGGRIYAMDALGMVSATDVKTGARLWEMETAPPESDTEVMGGGLAYDAKRLFVTTGFGEVLALDAADGNVIWRRGLSDPFRSAPVVDNGRVFVVGIDNETHALAEKDGAVLWRHAGINEATALMGASSPAVNGDTVVVAYTSGEIFALRAVNGRAAWGDVLSVPQQVGALPAMADIRGMPVIDRGGIFAMSHSGPLAAISQRSGERVWELDIGGTNTPVVAGNTVYALTNDGRLIAATLQSGRIIWIRQLETFEDADDKESDRIIWSGPVLAGGRLLLVNSFKQLVEISPFTGEDIKLHELPDPVFIAPVVAEQTLFVITDDGELIAYK
jgi:outer membrane protein assembly factor BamB